MTKTAANLIKDYQKIKEIVTQSPNITSEEFGEKLKGLKIDINFMDFKCSTLLHLAINNFTNESSNKESVSAIVKLLLINGANINAGYQNEDKRVFISPLNMAVIAALKGNISLLTIFIECRVINHNCMHEILEFVTLLDEHEEMTHRQEVIALLKSPRNKEKNVSHVNEDTVTSSHNINTDVIRPVAEVQPTTTSKTHTNRTEVISVDSQESKYKESRQVFLSSLGKDGFGVIATGLLITAAVRAQPVFVIVALSIFAASAAILTLLHVANYTLPSYREMKETQAESLGGNSKGGVVSGA